MRAACWAAEAEAARVRGEARASMEAKAALLVGRRRDLEVRSAGLLERKQFLEDRLADVERRLESDAEARAQVAGHRERIERILLATERLSTIVEAHRQTIEARLADLHERRRRQSDEVRSLAGRLDEMRRTRSASERELEELREVSRRNEVDEAEVKLRLEGTVEMAMNYSLTDDEVAEGYVLTCQAMPRSERVVVSYDA